MPNDEWLATTLGTFVIRHSTFVFSHMSDSAKTSIGIDFGGTSVKLGVCRGDELLVTDEPIPTANFHGPAALIGEMAARVAKLQTDLPRHLRHRRRRARPRRFRSRFRA
jgi:hypothetical protein